LKNYESAGTITQPINVHGIFMGCRAMVSPKLEKGKQKEECVAREEYGMLTSVAQLPVIQLMIHPRTIQLMIP